jgi:predicted metal-dependent HD superfamily phosphohydrolase
MATDARWGRLQELLDEVPLADEAKDRLFQEMSRPERHYHGVGHLANLWRLHRLYSGRAGLAGPEADRLVACAVAWHDSVYDSERHDNEDRSAEAWLAASAGARLAEAERQWVAGTIRATKDHLAYDPSPEAATSLPVRLRLWVLDLDLTSLGAAPEAFDRNTRLLRLENGRKSDAAWREGVMAFRRRFLDAPRIYRTPELAAIYEAPARRNLNRPLADVAGQLDKT